MRGRYSLLMRMTLRDKRCNPVEKDLLLSNERINAKQEKYKY